MLGRPIPAGFVVKVRNDDHSRAPPNSPRFRQLLALIAASGSRPPVPCESPGEIAGFSLATLCGARQKVYCGSTYPRIARTDISETREP
jgi:hypothetical protein